MYLSQGRFAEAEPLLKQALAIQKKALHEGHPDIAHSLNNLAALNSNQGRFAEAEPLYRQAVSIMLSTFGMEHPYCQEVLTNHLICLVEIGKEEEASRIAPDFPAWYRENIKNEG